MTDAAPTLPSLTTVAVALTGADGSRTTYQVMAEPTRNTNLVITPELNESGFTGRYSLTHVPSGRCIYRGDGDPYTLRALAERITHLDWSQSMEELRDSDTAVETKRVLRELQLTEPDGVELPAHPSWRGDGDGIKRTALPMVADMLATFQHAWNRTGGRPDSVPSSIPDPDRPGETKPNPEWHYLIIRQVECYGLAYLLAALHRVDPEVADSAAASLADAWDSGDSLGEWAYEWAQQIAKGEPLNLPGIPRADDEVFPNDTTGASRG